MPDAILSDCFPLVAVLANLYHGRSCPLTIDLNIAY